jgi:hypothetical protein
MGEFSGEFNSDRRSRHDRHQDGAEAPADRAILPSRVTGARDDGSCDDVARQKRERQNGFTG